MEPPKATRLFLIFLILSFLYILSQFYRVSNAVISPNLIKDLKLNAETLGILGGAYFYSFALLQIPMGPMLDRIGPRIILTVFPIIGACGSFLFGLSESFSMALWGRILIGVGMAPVLMGAMKIFILNFPNEKFSTLTGTILSIGTLGNIFAASPLAYITSLIGWRLTLILAGIITILLSIICFFSITEGKDKPPSSSYSNNKIGILYSLKVILGSLSFWQIGFLAFFRYGTFVCLQGLWLGPYLIYTKGFSPVQAGNLILLLSLGIVVGGPISGRISDRFIKSPKWVAFSGLTLYSICLLLLLIGGNIKTPIWYGSIFFGMGFFTSFGMLIYSHAKDLFPLSISGTAMTLVNFFTMAGGAVFMPAIGKVIKSISNGSSNYSLEAYHFSFLICLLGMIGSLIFYFFSKRRNQS